MITIKDIIKELSPYLRYLQTDIPEYDPEEIKQLQTELEEIIKITKTDNIEDTENAEDAEDYFRDLRTAAALAQPGSLAFEMETVEILSDASNDISEPVAPPETAPANKPE